jgi:hydrogenase maturation protease
MGDEGVGWHVAERLSADPRLPADVEAVCGGTDLLRHAARMEQSSRVIVIDAIEDKADPGTVSAFGDAPAVLQNRQEGAHTLSAVQAIQLLRMTLAAPITLLGVSIAGAQAGASLSAGIAARMPAIIDRVLRELG